MTFKTLRLTGYWACAATLCGLAAGAAAAGQLDQIRESRQITIAHRDASVPLSYVVGDDKKPVGYAVEICQKIAEAVRKELKLPALEVRYLSVTGANRIPTIVEGKAAMECGSTTNTAARRQQVDFTIAHFIAASRFLTRTATPGSTIGDLAGKTVVSTTGTTNILVMRNVNKEKNLDLDIMSAKDHAESALLVESGRADAFAMDDILLYGIKANSVNPAALAVVGEALQVEPYAIMLRRDDPAFKTLVDGTIATLIKSGDFQKLYTKWFQSPIPPKGVNLNAPMSDELKANLTALSDKPAL